MNIPEWLGWTIGMSPLLGLALFGLAEWRSVRHKITTPATVAQFEGSEAVSRHEYARGGLPKLSPRKGSASR